MARKRSASWRAEKRSTKRRPRVPEKIQHEPKPDEKLNWHKRGSTRTKLQHRSGETEQNGTNHDDACNRASSWRSSWFIKSFLTRELVDQNVRNIKEREWAQNKRRKLTSPTADEEQHCANGRWTATVTCKHPSRAQKLPRRRTYTKKRRIRAARRAAAASPDLALDLNEDIGLMNAAENGLMRIDGMKTIFKRFPVRTRSIDHASPEWIRRSQPPQRLARACRPSIGPGMWQRSK